jgi:hypothetical protein
MPAAPGSANTLVLRAEPLSGEIRINGRLDEPAWQRAEAAIYTGNLTGPSDRPTAAFHHQLTDNHDFNPDPAPEVGSDSFRPRDRLIACRS